MNDNETKEEQGKRLSNWIINLEDSLRKTQKSRDKWKTQCLAETEACAKFWIGVLISEVGTRMSIDSINAWNTITARLFVVARSLCTTTQWCPRMFVKSSH